MVRDSDEYFNRTTTENQKGHYEISTVVELS